MRLPLPAPSLDEPMQAVRRERRRSHAMTTTAPANAAVRRPPPKPARLSRRQQRRLGIHRLLFAGKVVAFLSTVCAVVWTLRELHRSPIGRRRDEGELLTEADLATVVNGQPLKLDARQNSVNDVGPAALVLPRAYETALLLVPGRPDLASTPSYVSCHSRPLQGGGELQRFWPAERPLLPALWRRCLPPKSLGNGRFRAQPRSCGHH